MTKNNGVGEKCLVIIIVGFLISSASVLLIPFASFEKTGLPYTLSYVIGGVFWFGIIASILSILILNSIRVKNEKNLKKKGSKVSIGVFRFFSNKTAVIFDWIFIISLLILLITMFFENINQTVSITIMFLTAFTFEMHCVFNGKNYDYLVKSKKN